MVYPDRITRPDGTVIRYLEERRIYRVVDEVTYDDGAWWALELPKNKTEWRRDYAVKDGWNDNGYVGKHTAPEEGYKAWMGKAAGQEYSDGKFHLKGGKEQLYIDPPNISKEEIKIELTNWPEP